MRMVGRIVRVCGTLLPTTRNGTNQVRDTLPVPVSSPRAPLRFGPGRCVQTSGLAHALPLPAEKRLTAPGSFWYNLCAVLHVYDLFRGLVGKETRPLILCTNDDGIASPGLRAAVEAICDLGEIWVVAPRSQQTGMARSLPAGDGVIYTEDLRIRGCPIRAFSLETSPAGVVLYAMVEILPRYPDLAVIGINYGENVGSGITSSGTIGAALETASWGIPSLAVSLETEARHHYSHSEEVDFSVAAVFVRRFACSLLRHRLPKGVDILKVDIPSDATPDAPWRLTRVSRQRYFHPTRGRKPDGSPGGPLGYEARVDRDTLEPDSDVAALVYDRVVSVSPLTIDLTAQADRVALEALLRQVDHLDMKRGER